MKRIKNKKEVDRNHNEIGREKKVRLAPDIKRSLWAIIFVGLTVIFLLMVFDQAGAAGSLLFKALTAVFGKVGYFILPALSAALALFFLFASTFPFKETLIGGPLIIAATLGLLDIIMPEQSGYLGILFGSLKYLFKETASLVILVIAFFAGIVVQFNISLSFTKKSGSPNEIEFDEPEIPEDKISESSQSLSKNVFVSENIDNPDFDKLEKGSKKNSTQAAAAAEHEFAEIKKAKIKTDYQFPPPNLLESKVEKPSAGDLRANANIIKRTLESFGIPVEMGEITIGPKVTRYTLKPAEGVKIAKITALNQDLALSLAAQPIRIEAPIPGKSLVGIEVPNKTGATVRLGSLVATEEFKKSGLLSFVIGRDINGDAIVGNLEKMPHLLIAGATGSGKSITIHSILISLLYKNSPETLKLALIDPKKVELSIYNNLPHLIAPVITENKKALGVLRWAISEMESRYDILLREGSRDIQSYNKKLVLSSSKETPYEPMPYLVIVIDELADLMASYGHDVEGSIIRLAQMARATGIHLIVSTQRPSVEVVTGLIKANITSRIALQVASQIDSRTILDTSGAEKLLGAGDLLFISGELSKPKRIQGAYITEEEIQGVVTFIKKQKLTTETQEKEIFAKPEKSSERTSNDVFDEFAGGDGEDDEILEEAIQVVREMKRASASLLQRKLKLGYARAARLLDIMEEKGLIGPVQGAKPREIYIPDDQTSDAKES